MTQLRRRTPEKHILDNVSIHKSGRTKKYLERHPEISLFYLPAYSPEYNPVELFRKWIKPKVYGFSPAGWIDGMISGFRKLVWHYNRQKLYHPIRFHLKMYQNYYKYLWRYAYKHLADHVTKESFEDIAQIMLNAIGTSMTGTPPTQFRIDYFGMVKNIGDFKDILNKIKFVTNDTFTLTKN